MPERDRALRKPLPRRLVVHPGHRLLELPQVRALDSELRRDIHVVSRVLPFKVNDYVLNELIEWSDVPNDPIYRLTFPHRDMLDPAAYARMAGLIDRGAPLGEVNAAAEEIRLALNPHPAAQLEHNVPMWAGERLDGVQHKYRETVLVFPSQGQTCHAYCGYCFRWAQFVGVTDLRQAARDPRTVADYLAAHPRVTDVLFTGGDPMVMSASVLARWIEPLFEGCLEHVQSIRIGTKSLAYWPYRFVSDPDADDLLRLFERCARRGKHVAVMAHFTHPRELQTNVVSMAVRRLRNAGAVIRTQSPIVRHVNDGAEVWKEMWREQVRTGCVPYYMFVERDTGSRRYYEIPLAEAWNVYRQARNGVSGLARTARGPSMSATPGKVCIDGVVRIAGEEVFCLRFLQARNPDWVGRPFFARYDRRATWLDQLEPAFGERRFFFEDPTEQGGMRPWNRAPGSARSSQERYRPDEIRRRP